MQRRHDQENVPIEILRSFVTILDTNSFTQAAVAMGLTQSAISAQMKRLQNILGDELFVRQPTGVTLTKRGELVATFARRIVGLTDQLLTLNAQDLRIGLPSLYSKPLLRRLTEKRAQLGLGNLQYRFDSSGSLIKQLEARHLDVALVLSPASRPDARRSWSYRMVWVTSRDFVHDPSKPIPWLSWPGSTTDGLAAIAFRNGGVQYQAVSISTDQTSATESVYAGLGFRLMPYNHVPRDLKIVEQGVLPDAGDLYVCILVNDDNENEGVRSLVEILEEMVRGAEVRPEPAASTLNHGDNARSTARLGPGKAHSNVDYVAEGERYRKKAEECRSLSETAYLNVSRDQLAKIADTYDGMAEEMERLAKSGHPCKKAG
ncbi:LysR family transcriptional regulator [Rhodoplanes sp. Z2-YC6860]|uniref:LysR family transcriptional regulator n=1 Tax=Rhodoplanes sp. Z2-YC6860 TaxID=674703 RepID=UPI00078E4814|nr:LysR family transcriptional regulator [Rhodoplanes sp. Z2-YC6860]AMN41413.1 LysR family transcriptional regulator [Rhodoplanes sp. Z2-YC6860]